MRQYKIFRFVKQIFISTLMFFGCNLSNVNSLSVTPLSATSQVYFNESRMQSKMRNY